MKKVAIVAAMLTLAGCVQVDNYQEVIKRYLRNWQVTGSRKGRRARW